MFITKQTCNEFVDIHGRNLTVVLDSGEIYIPLHELRQCGFAIYKKHQYDALHVTDAQFNDEFYSYMLDAATTFMLTNQLRFEQTQVLDVIERCREALRLRAGAPSAECSFGSASTSSPTAPRLPTTNVEAFLHRQRRVEPKTVKEFVRKLKQDGASAVGVSNGSDDSQKGEVTADFGQKERENIRESSPTRVLHESNDLPKSESSNSSQKENSPPASHQSNGKVSKLDSATLTDGIHDLFVTRVDERKPSIAWVRHKAHNSMFEAVRAKIREHAPNLRSVRTKFVPQRVYLVEERGEWSRAIFVRMRPFIVKLIDYGSYISEEDATLLNIKESNEEISALPLLAIRISIYNFSDYKVQSGDEVQAKVMNQYKDGTYTLQILKTNRNSTSPISERLNKSNIDECFVLPKSQTEIENDQQVAILDEENGIFSLQTRDDYKLLAQITTKIGQVELQPVKTPKNNLLVLAPRVNSTDQLVYARAVIQNIFDKQASVEFLDYAETGTISFERLRQLDKQLAELPRAYFKSILLSRPFTSNEKVRNYIESAIDKRTKFNTVYTGGNYDLVDLNSKLLLSELLNALNKEKKVEKLVNGENGDKRIMLSDIPEYKPEKGVQGYMCTVFTNLECLYFVSTTALEKKVADILYYEMTDDKDHRPITGEVCFGFYNNIWYRCAISRIIGETFEVLFIDFGNQEILSAKDLRRGRDEFCKIEALAMPCRFVDLPKVDKIENALLQVVKQDEFYNVDVKGLLNGKHNITIPSAYEQLKSIV